MRAWRGICTESSWLGQRRDGTLPPAARARTGATRTAARQPHFSGYERATMAEAPAPPGGDTIRFHGVRATERDDALDTKVVVTQNIYASKRVKNEDHLPPFAVPPFFIPAAHSQSAPNVLSLNYAKRPHPPSTGYSPSCSINCVVEVRVSAIVAKRRSREQAWRSQVQTRGCASFDPPPSGDCP
jgi:hypothetical protein